MKNKPPYALTSVDNVLLLIHLLRDQGQVKVSEAARELGIARSTAHRLLAMLVYRDFAVQDGNHNYLPGPFLAMGPGGATPVRELRAVAQPHMEDLCQRVQETVNLMVRVGAEVRFIASVESVRVLHVGDRRGTILPAHRASGGKALLAELPPDRLAELYAPDALPAAERTRLLRELDLVRAHGHGVNMEETEEGVSAIGAAVHDGQGTAVAALSIAAPSTRFRGDRVELFARELARTVREVERGLKDLPNPG
ncbi:IclR family transcriptional regulator [Spirillospora sp. NPDC029432]|uniref:IclR family transcriptional regulator n=1 Tax=Spirillospora sp. NPDC029432 TaxID=3154599 RepID=UPI0034565870